MRHVLDEVVLYALGFRTLFHYLLLEFLGFTNLDTPFDVIQWGNAKLGLELGAQRVCIAESTFVCNLTEILACVLSHQVCCHDNSQLLRIILCLGSICLFIAKTESGQFVLLLDDIVNRIDNSLVALVEFAVVYHHGGKKESYYKQNKGKYLYGIFLL